MATSEVARGPTEPPGIEPSAPRLRSARGPSHRGFWGAFPFVLPSIIVIVAVVGFPIIYAGWLSFTDFRLLAPDTSFTGLQNYQAVFSDQLFWHSLRNTLLFLLVTVNGSFLLGLLTAELVARMTRGQGALRVLIMTPMMFAPVLVGFQFRWFYNAQVGLINNIMVDLNLITDRIPWLVERATALFAVMTADMWMNTPIVAIILLAGRLSLPTDLEEAAKIDGASAWQTFRLVILPQLMPFVYIALVIRSLDVARAFDIVQIMTGGGPANRTELLWTYIYRTAMQDGRFGVGAAMSYLTIIITIAVVAFLFRQLIKARVIR